MFSVQKQIPWFFNFHYYSLSPHHMGGKVGTQPFLVPLNLQHFPVSRKEHRICTINWEECQGNDLVKNFYITLLQLQKQCYHNVYEGNFDLKTSDLHGCHNLQQPKNTQTLNRHPSKERVNPFKSKPQLPTVLEE